MPLKHMWTSLLVMDITHDVFTMIVLSLLRTLILYDKHSVTGAQVNTSCDFDSGLCDGWRQSNSDVFNWTRHTGTTPSHNTGPDGDHTSGSGYYMFIETSSPRVAGDNAKLEFSVPGNLIGELSCLEFYYHMFGSTMGTLAVFSGNETVFNKSESHGHVWIGAKITIHLNETVIFEGIVGSSFTGDLAIDDVSIRSGRCEVGCDFDIGLCDGWHQSTSDVFDWTRHTGSTTTANTGPDYDHTSGLGYYMYINTSSPRAAGDNAKLELSAPGDGELSCLRFYYHMYGDTVGTLVFSGNMAVFHASGSHGHDWIEAERTISSNKTVTFEGIVGCSDASDLAIDDVSIRSGSCPVGTSCDFDSGLCDGWRQSNADVFDWTRNTGSTASPNTGPSFDHTSGSGYYMYIETSSPRVAGDNAKLELFVPVNGELSCLKFYYHMYGDPMGTLTVFSGKVAVFNASGYHGTTWIEAKRTIFSNETVTFEGIVGSSSRGDLAIDDVSISNGSCGVSTSCDFDRGLCDGWRQSNSDVFDWTRQKGATPSFPYTGPSNDHTSMSGYYMFIETSSPRFAGENAKLELSVAGNGELSCLTFYYHMYGYTMGTLTVYSRYMTVFNTSGYHGDNWIEAKRTIYLNKTVTFEGIRGSSFSSDIAIDDVSITNGSCPLSTSCDFDSGLCDGWRQSYSDAFDWTRGTGPTPSTDTGPDNDHTSGSGYYMYIEASDPRVAGDNAKLELSVSGNGELSCLVFYYHMYGYTVGTLAVFSGNAVVFNKSGSHGDRWGKQELTILLNNTVTFEGIVGSSFMGDLAIDDVSITNGSCQVHTGPPTSSTEPSFYSDPSTLNPSTDTPSVSSTNEPSLATGMSTLHSSIDNSSIPFTPSLKETQESVLLEVQDLDIQKWSGKMERGFKKEIARAATDYCADDGTRCHLTPTSFRRKRSSDNLIFTSDMVHILPGYPKNSSDDPRITLVAFYLLLPQGISDDIVHKDLLQAIVESDVSSIEKLIGGTILSVQPLFTNTATTIVESDEELAPTIVIIGASVCIALLMVIICALVLGRKRFRRFKHQRANVAFNIDSGQQDIEVK